MATWRTHYPRSVAPVRRINEDEALTNVASTGPLLGSVTYDASVNVTAGDQNGYYLDTTLIDVPGQRFISLFYQHQVAVTAGNAQTSFTTPAVIPTDYRPDAAVSSFSVVHSASGQGATACQITFLPTGQISVEFLSKAGTNATLHYIQSNITYKKNTA